MVRVAEMIPPGKTTIPFCPSYIVNTGPDEDLGAA